MSQKGRQFRETRKYKYEIAPGNGSKIFIRRKTLEKGYDKIQPRNNTKQNQKAGIDSFKIKECCVLLTPLNIRRDTDSLRNEIKDTPKMLQFEDDSDSKIVPIDCSHQISVVNVDDISDNDVMEYIDITSPTKTVPDNVPMHHRKKLLKKYLAEEEATIFAVTYDNKNEEAAGIDVSVQDLLDEDDFNFSLDKLIGMLDSFEFKAIDDALESL